MVRTLAAPGGPSATQLAQEVSVPQSTLSRWLRQAGRFGEDPQDAPSKPHRRPMAAKRPQDWTAEEKLEAVVAASGLSEEELGAFLRRQGLHEAQLEEWRQQVLASLARRPARSKKPTEEARRIRGLERELARKDKALAEAAALLVLKKKAQEIWGDEADDTNRKSGGAS